MFLRFEKMLYCRYDDLNSGWGFAGTFITAVNS